MRRSVAVMFVAALMVSCSPSSAEVITAAPDLARQKGSAKMEMTVTTRISGGPGGQSFESSVRGEGASDFTARAGRMSMTVSITPDPGFALERCDMISKGSDVYVGIPESRRQGGQSWVKVDLSKIQGLDANSFASDPTVSLEYLKSVSENVEEIGREDVRGVATTHYRYTIGVDRLFEKLDAETRDRQKAAMEQLGITQMPIDAWIDDDGLPRRVAFEMTPKGQQLQFELKGTVDMFDYGAPVDVEVPAASEVREETQPQLAFAGCFGGPSPGAVPTQP